MYNVSTSPKRRNHLGQMIVSTIVALVVLGAVANQLGLVDGARQLWVTLFSSPEAEAYKKGLAELETMERRNLEPAFADFTRAITLNPNYVPAYRKRSVVYFLLDMPERGMEDINRAIELEPKNPELYVQRSAGWLAQGKPDGNEFLSDLNKAIELKPDYFEAFIVRGISYRNLHLWDKALSDLNRAVELKPWRIAPTQEYALYINRGLAFLATNKLDAALSDFDRTVKIFPKQGQAYRNRGDAYLKKGQFKEAATDYLKTLELEPTYNLTDVLADFQNHVATESDAATKAEMEKLIAQIQQK